MAKNIDFMGAIFPDVPSVKLPQQGGGLVSFDDTTDANATASDIAQGKTAYVNGEKVVGTASGGSAVIEPLSVTANGTYTAPSGVDGYSPVTVNVSGGGGGSDIVFFEFTTNSTEGIQEVTVPYTGNGYPIVFAMNCDDISIRTTASGKVSASLYVDKEDKTTAPNYSGSNADKALIYEFCRYSGTSSATRFSCLGSGSGTDFFNASNPTASDYAKVRMQSKNKFKVYISTSTSVAGLKAGTKYVVFIKYSE